MREYLFSMLEKDFNKDIHEVTGLWDKDGRPIVRMKYETERKFPIGFGRHIEWNSYHQPKS